MSATPAATPPLGVHDPAFVQKLGIGERMLVVVREPDLVAALRARLPPGAQMFAEPLRHDRADVLLRRFAPGDDLVGAFRKLRHQIKDTGAVWAIIPKKRAVGEVAAAVTFEALLDAAKRAGMVDTKQLTFSETEYGLRFVLRRDSRR